MIADFYWGIPLEEYYGSIGGNTVSSYTNSLLSISKKRKLSDVEDNDHKNYQIYDPLIYTMGKEVHFSAGIDKLTIEILIKHMSAVINAYYDEHDARGEELVVTYVVDSPGGSVLSVLKFVDFIRLSKFKYPKLKFKSVISGLAASAGTIMSCIADERIMTKNAKSMIHDLSGSIPGTYTQMMSQVEFIKDLNFSLVDIYEEKCNKTREELVELLKTNKWFNAKQYLEFGFVDMII
jgi:ATP-dependent protease ClpP protease subunit